MRVATLFLLLVSLLPPLTFSADLTEGWKPLTLPDAAKGKALHGVFFLDNQHGWLVGAQGLCLATADGGTTWRVQQTGSKATLRCIRFTDAKNGWACGDGDPDAPETKGHLYLLRPKKASTLLHTEDGGKTWQTHRITTNFEIHSVEPGAAPIIQVGVSGGEDHPDGDITRSPDGGKTWKIRRCYRALFSVNRLDENRWVGVGASVCVGFLPTPKEELYTNKACRAIYTDDGGQTWRPAQGSEGKGHLRGLAYAKGRPLVAVGDHGGIFVSKDNGGRWEAVKSPTKQHLKAVAWCGTTAVAVGVKGTVLVGTNDGAEWKELSAGTTEDLLSVAGAGDRAVVVGKNGTALVATVVPSTGQDQKPTQSSADRLAAIKKERADAFISKVGNTAFAPPL